MAKALVNPFPFFKPLILWMDVIAEVSKESAFW